MSAPRVEIDLDQVGQNATALVTRLGSRGIAVTGVTKAVLGSPDVANAMLDAGVVGIGDSRIENIERMRAAGITAPMSLIRSPMGSQADRVVEHADISFNTELGVIAKLSASALLHGRTHGIVLMVELGDLREGILPKHLQGFVRKMLSYPNLVLRGIGTNLACRCGVAPDLFKMRELSKLADEMEHTFGITFDIVSGGNSANLDWALSGGDAGRVNDLRLGESILLGRETLRRRAINGLHTNAVTLVAEVIESKPKPSMPWGTVAQAAFGPPEVHVDRGDIDQAILAIGRADTDPDGLTPRDDITILGASSDHLVVESKARTPPAVGDEMRFDVNYSALVRSMTSPYVDTVMSGRTPATVAPTGV